MKSAVSASTVHSPTKNQRIRHENTFRMEPESVTKFTPGRCQEVLQQVLKANLDGASYDSRATAGLSKTISDEIKFRVKEFKIPRYKIIAQVFIGSKSGQCMQMASRSVWDPSTDNFASQSYENESLFAVATVHCTYFE